MDFVWILFNKKSIPIQQQKAKTTRPNIQWTVNTQMPVKLEWQQQKHTYSRRQAKKKHKKTGLGMAEIPMVTESDKIKIMKK